MVHKGSDLGYANHVPGLEEIEMITVGHKDAQLLKVFLLSQEKEALRELAAKKNLPMYHLVRGLILQAIEQQNEAS